jgi:hypothetical protein
MVERISPPLAIDGAEPVCNERRCILAGMSLPAQKNAKNASNAG